MLDAPVPLTSEATLERLTAGDGDAFAAHIAGDEPHLGEFLPWPALTARPAGAAQWLRRYERKEEGRVVAAGVRLRGELVGGAVLLNHDHGTAAVELGVWIAGGAEATGLAAAACRVLLGVARDELRAERVAWQSATGNVRSRRLAERLGFVHEGTLRSSVVLRGARLDLDVLSLIGPEIDRSLGRAA